MMPRPEQIDREAIRKLNDLVTENIPRDWWGKIEFNVRDGHVESSAVHQSFKIEKKETT